MQTLKFCFVSHNNISKFVYTQILCYIAHPNLPDATAWARLGAVRAADPDHSGWPGPGGQGKWAENLKKTRCSVPTLPSPSPCQCAWHCAKASRRVPQLRLIL